MQESDALGETQHNKLPVKYTICNDTTDHRQLLLHLFNGLFSRTTWVSRYQKGKTVQSGFKWGKRWCGFGTQWHQLDNMQTICTSLQTDNHTNTSSLNFYRLDALLDGNQQCQSTEGRCYRSQTGQQHEKYNGHLVPASSDAAWTDTEDAIWTSAWCMQQFSCCSAKLSHISFKPWPQQLRTGFKWLRYKIYGVIQ